MCQWVFEEGRGGVRAICIENISGVFEQENLAVTGIRTVCSGCVSGYWSRLWDIIGRAHYARSMIPEIAVCQRTRTSNKIQYFLLCC